MLDKNVPFMDVMMHRKAGTQIPETSLPEGFTLKYYKIGDEKAWAKIETSVLEFTDEQAALEYFQKEFLPMRSELERRCIFIENGNGDKVATATAWWGYTGVKRSPLLHWVSVMPDYQGMGLGKAIISKAARLMLDIEGDRDFYLHTQTWSHVAIRLYLKYGFTITGEPGLFNYANDKYPKNVELLKSLGVEI